MFFYAERDTGESLFVVLISREIKKSVKSEQSDKAKINLLYNVIFGYKIKKATVIV